MCAEEEQPRGSAAGHRHSASGAGGIRDISKALFINDITRRGGWRGRAKMMCHDVVTRGERCWPKSGIPRYWSALAASSLLCFNLESWAVIWFHGEGGAAKNNDCGRR